MTRIYRCRTALSEAGALFDASWQAGATWSGEVYPERMGLIVTQGEAARRIKPARWGIDARKLGLSGSGACPTLWFREVWEQTRHWLEPASRCVILLDCFSAPTSVAGRTSKAWFGIEGTALMGWAGIVSGEGAGTAFAGFIVAGNALVGAERVMPALLRPEEAETWLQGDMSDAARLARRTIDAGDMWREAIGEPWNRR